MELTLSKILSENEKNPLFVSLLGKGVIPITILDKKVYYEYYLKQCEELQSSHEKKWKLLAVTLTAEEFHVAESTIYRAIKKMTT